MRGLWNRPGQSATSSSSSPRRAGREARPRRRHDRRRARRRLGDRGARATGVAGAKILFGEAGSPRPGRVGEHAAAVLLDPPRVRRLALLRARQAASSPRSRHGRDRPASQARTLHRAPQSLSQPTTPCFRQPDPLLSLPTPKLTGGTPRRLRRGSRNEDFEALWRAGAHRASAISRLRQRAPPSRARRDSPKTALVCQKLTIRRSPAERGRRGCRRRDRYRTTPWTPASQNPDLRKRDPSSQHARPRRCPLVGRGLAPQPPQHAGPAGGQLRVRKPIDQRTA